jgi:hypothetical protein
VGQSLSFVNLTLRAKIKEAPKQSNFGELLHLHKNHPLKSLFNSCDLEEVKSLLFRTGSTTEFDLVNRVETITSSDQFRKIQIHYHKKGTVKDVLTHHGFDTASEMELLRSTLLENQQPKFSQRVAYATNKLRGCFGIENVFQISPILTGRDENLITLAGEPLKFEFSYTGSHDQFINIRRAEKRSYELLRVLNVLLRDSMWFGPRYSTEEWFYDYESQTNRTAFVGFVDSAVGSPSGSLFDCGLPAAKCEPPNDYYENMHVALGDDMVFPSNLQSLLSTYSSLPGNEKNAYDMAISWYADARKIAPISSSACFNTLATAIECLLDDKVETCGECSQPKYGISRKFNEFLIQYVPMKNGIDRAKTFKDLYSTRSTLVHGSGKYAHDLFGSMGGFETTRDRAELRLMIQVAKVALINWLISKQ